MEGGGGVEEEMGAGVAGGGGAGRGGVQTTEKGVGGLAVIPHPRTGKFIQTNLAIISPSQSRLVFDSSSCQHGIGTGFQRVHESSLC